MANNSTLIKPALNTAQDDPTDRAELGRLIKQFSFRKGDFVLASGKRSTYYIDCRTTTLHGRGAYLIGKLFYHRIVALNVDSVGGVVLGAAPMVTAITTRSAEVGHPLNGFLIRKEAKGHGTGKQLEGHIAPWMRVVLVEDVVSTGGSIVKGIQALKATYPSVKIEAVLAIVDRNMGGSEAIANAITGEAIPFQALYGVDEFLAE